VSILQQILFVNICYTLAPNEFGVPTNCMELKPKVVEYLDHLQPIKYLPYLPKAFTKKYLWMLATILSSK